MKKLKILFALIFIFLFFGLACKNGATSSSSVTKSSKEGKNFRNTFKSDKKNIYEKFHIKEVQTDFEKAYLELMLQIDAKSNEEDIDVKKLKKLYGEYGYKLLKFKKARKALRLIQKKRRKRCIGYMKSLVKAIIKYDKKFHTKTVIFDGKKLLKAKILKSIPKCPSGGKYFIKLSTNRKKRTFYCSVHGPLKRK